MHHHRLRKTQDVAEAPIIGNGGGKTNRTERKVTGSGWFAIRHHTDIMRANKIVVLF
jgi:hypothetical protein